MTGREGNLVDRFLAEENARHIAAIAAIDARKADIAELARLSTLLKARGFRAAEYAATTLVGADCACTLRLWLTATRAELNEVLEQLAADGVEFGRQCETDVGDSISYSLKLARQTLRLQVFIHAGTSTRSSQSLAA
jgi:hypothetical protein